MAAERHCQGRLVSVLEGGYDIEALSSCIQAHVCALSGIPCPDKTRGLIPQDTLKKQENATCPHCGRKVEEFPTGLPGLSRHIRACPQAPARGGIPIGPDGMSEESCSRCGIKLSSFASGLRGLAAHIWQCKGGFGADVEEEPMFAPVSATPPPPAPVGANEQYRKDFERISETDDESKLSCPYCQRPGSSFKAAKRGLRAHIPQCPKNPHRVEPKQVQPWLDQNRPLLDQKDLIERVKLIMAERGLTQDHVTMVAGLTSSGLLSAWLRDKCKSRSDVDEQMQAWLEVVEEQFGGPTSASGSGEECPHCEKTVGSFASGLMGLRAHVRQCRGREGMAARTQVRRVLISRVKQIMTLHELTQDDVTHQAGLSSSGTISRWLRGLCKPDGEIDTKLEEWLLKHEGVAPRAPPPASSTTPLVKSSSSPSFALDEARRRDMSAIKKLMQERGYTQDDVASGAQLSSSGLLSAWLRDKCRNRPDVDQAMSAWLLAEKKRHGDSGSLSAPERSSGKLGFAGVCSSPTKQSPPVVCSTAMQIKEEIERRCFFQSDVASAAGVSTSKLSEWLLGKVLNPEMEKKMEEWIEKLEPMDNEEGSCPHCGKTSSAFQGGFTGLRIHIRQCRGRTLAASPKRSAQLTSPKQAGRQESGMHLLNGVLCLNESTTQILTLVCCRWITGSAGRRG